MIIFNLCCKNCSFEFEGWFDSSKDYEKQKRKNLINCPSCNSHTVKKFLMTPNLSSKTNKKNEHKPKKTLINQIDKYKKIIEKDYDYVGNNFTEEAKKMKYGEIKERAIYGDANLEQTKELIDEEIPIVPLPWTPSKKIN